jgi:hypothetical protein
VGVGQEKRGLWAVFRLPGQQVQVQDSICVGEFLPGSYFGWRAVILPLFVCLVDAAGLFEGCGKKGD